MRVLLFAQARELCGGLSEAEIALADVAEGACTGRQLLDHLLQRWPRCVV